MAAGLYQALRLSLIGIWYDALSVRSFRGLDASIPFGQEAPLDNGTSVDSGGPTWSDRH